MILIKQMSCRQITDGLLHGCYNKYVKVLVKNCLKLQLRLIREGLENISNDSYGIYTHTFLSLCLNALPIHSKNVFWIPSHTVKGNNSFWFYTSRYISHVTVKFHVSEYIYIGLLEEVDENIISAWKRVVHPTLT